MGRKEKGPVRQKEESIRNRSSNVEERTTCGNERGKQEVQRLNKWRIRIKGG